MLGLSGKQEFLMNDKTNIFIIPPDGDLDNFTVSSIEQVINGKTYSLKAFNTNIRTGIAEAVLLFTDMEYTIDEYNKPHMLVTKVSMVKNKKGEDCYKIYYVKGTGAMNSIVCDSKVVLQKYTRNPTNTFAAIRPDVNSIIPISNLKPGAVIVVNDDQSIINTINLRYPIDGNYSTPDKPWTFDYKWGGETQFGSVYAKEDRSIAISADRLYYTSLQPSVKIYLWDLSKQTGRPGTISDIMPADVVGDDNCSYVYYQRQINYLYIFKR
jgi:hypothetical protein